MEKITREELMEKMKGLDDEALDSVSGGGYDAYNFCFDMQMVSYLKPCLAGAKGAGEYGAGMERACWDNFSQRVNEKCGGLKGRPITDYNP